MVVRYIAVLFHTFYCNLSQVEEFCQFIITGTLLYRGQQQTGNKNKTNCSVTEQMSTDLGFDDVV